MGPKTTNLIMPPFSLEDGVGRKCGGFLCISVHEVQYESFFGRGSCVFGPSSFFMVMLFLNCLKKLIFLRTLIEVNGAKHAPFWFKSSSCTFLSFRHWATGTQMLECEWGQLKSMGFGLLNVLEVRATNSGVNGGSLFHKFEAVRTFLIH